MPAVLVVRFRRLYGAHPVQLALILGSFVVVGYVLYVLGFKALYNTDVWWQSIALWFIGAALAHDLVLFPAYAVADRVMTTITDRATRRARRPPRIPVVNFVRFPLMAVGLVTLLFFPGLIKQGAGSYNRATGQTQEPFLHRWVILCAVILLLGVIAYVVARLTWGRRTGADAEPPPDLMAQVKSEAAATAAAAVAEEKSRVPLAGVRPWSVLVVTALVVLAARRRKS